MTEVVVLTQKPRPTFTDCVKRIRKYIGAKTNAVELHHPDALEFRFDRSRRYDAAYRALLQLNPIYAEQYLCSDSRRSITIYRRTCAHCGQKHDEHQPAGGQCLFMATYFTERTDGP
jgi:hypothetical protein